jgi:hypothetical protein
MSIVIERTCKRNRKRFIPLPNGQFIMEITTVIYKYTQYIYPHEAFDTIGPYSFQRHYILCGLPTNNTKFISIED